MTMTATNAEPVSTLKIVKEQVIAASIEVVFQAMLDELGPECQLMDGHPFPMKLEPWPGGRWYRDLGNNTGHFWGNVQVIKPPTLLEICGPMPMSYPAVNHIQYRLTAQDGGTLLKFTHQSMGLLTRDHREGTPQGWEFTVKRIAQIAESRTGKKR